MIMLVTHLIKLFDERCNCKSQYIMSPATESHNFCITIKYNLRTSVLLDVPNATDFQVSNFMFRLQYYVAIISFHKDYNNLNCNIIVK